MMSTEAADLKTKETTIEATAHWEKKKKTPTETAGTKAEEATIVATVPWPSKRRPNYWINVEKEEEKQTNLNLNCKRSFS